MNTQQVIAFVGMPGSGKGTCTDYLASKGHPVVHFGNMVFEEVEKRGLDNVLDERSVREDMREEEGKAVLAKRAALKADQYFNEGKSVVVFDGLYSWSEYKFLEEKYGEQFMVVCVFTPRHIRYQRVVSRKDAHRTYTIEQIKLREVEEIEGLEKGGPIARADHTIVNHGTPDELITSLESVLAQSGLKP
jgi:dephospho-CoA kinase